MAVTREEEFRQKVANFTKFVSELWPDNPALKDLIPEAQETEQIVYWVRSLLSPHKKHFVECNRNRVMSLFKLHLTETEIQELSRDDFSKLCLYLEYFVVSCETN